VATTNPLEDLGKAHLAVGSLEDLDWERFMALFD
jgi:hypothetical protein